MIIEDNDSDGRIAICVDNLCGFFQDPDSETVIVDVKSADGVIVQIKTKNSMSDIHELLREV